MQRLFVCISFMSLSGRCRLASLRTKSFSCAPRDSLTYRLSSSSFSFTSANAPTLALTLWCSCSSSAILAFSSAGVGVGPTLGPRTSRGSSFTAFLCLGGIQGGAPKDFLYDEKHVGRERERGTAHGVVCVCSIKPVFQVRLASRLFPHPKKKVWRSVSFWL